MISAFSAKETFSISVNLPTGTAIMCCPQTIQTLKKNSWPDVYCGTKIKDTTESNTSAAHLDLLLSIEGSNHSLFMTYSMMLILRYRTEYFYTFGIG